MSSPEKRMKAHESAINTTTLLSNLAWRGVSADNLAVLEAIEADRLLQEEAGYTPKDRLAQYEKDLADRRDRTDRPPANDLRNSNQSVFVYEVWNGTESSD